MQRTCIRCNTEKPLDNFSNNRNVPGGKCRYCRSCMSAYYGKRYKSHYQTYEQKRERRIKMKFGITQSDYNFMLAEQNGVCAICGEPEKLGKKSPDSDSLMLSIDHCHATGSIRGLLCGQCNRGIGFLKDDIKILQSSIRYLEAHNNESI